MTLFRYHIPPLSKHEATETRESMYVVSVRHKKHSSNKWGCPKDPSPVSKPSIIPHCRTLPTPTSLVCWSGMTCSCTLIRDVPILL